MGAGVGGLLLDYAYLPSSVGGDNQRLGIVLYLATVHTASGASEVKSTPPTPDTNKQQSSRWHPVSGASFLRAA